MGKLLYAQAAQFDIDDRVLSHIRVVHMTKMRRGEGFVLHLPDPNKMGTRILWLGPTVPVEFRFLGSRQPSMNGRWIDQMMLEANGSNGLTLRPEPAHA